MRLIQTRFLFCADSHEGCPYNVAAAVGEAICESLSLECAGERTVARVVPIKKSLAGGPDDDREKDPQER